MRQSPINGHFLGLPEGAVLLLDGRVFRITYQGGTGNDVVLSEVSPISDMTTTALTSTTNPSVVGQSVTFTAFVTPVVAGSGTPTGNVVFSVDGVAVATVPVVAGQASFTPSAALPLGPHAITAEYSGDGTFTASAAALLERVDPADTSVGLVSSSNPASFDQPVTFTATVSVTSPGAGTPTGTVTFFDGTTELGTVALQVVGGFDQASFTTDGLTIGSHVITAFYNGDDNFISSTSSALNQSVVFPYSGIHEFSVSNYPFESVVGPDGNLYFTESIANRIGRITPAGVVTEFVIPTANRVPSTTSAGAVRPADLVREPSRG
ncbi:MAG: Ig-like domain-containing protein [Gemmataceae bacterium]|nr:Ig-like domain-containing protein [Gemmataceae bacterium]